MVNSQNCIVIFALAIQAVPAMAMAPLTGGADEISAIEAHPNGRGGTIVLRGSHAPVFSVFRLTDPDRIVVDLAGADVSKATAPEHPAIVGLGTVSAVQFQKGDVRVGRVVLAADPTLAYEVKVVRNDVLIALTSGASAPAPLPVDDGDSNAPPKSAVSVTGEPTVAPDAPFPDVHLIDRQVDVVKGHRKLGRRVLSAWGGDRSRLAIKTDGAVGNVTVLRLRDPSRVAVDLEGFDVKGARSLTTGTEISVRFGKTDAGARVVFDLAGAEVPRFAVKRTSAGLMLLAETATPTPAPPAVVAVTSPRTAIVEHSPASEPKAKAPALTSVAAPGMTAQLDARPPPAPSSTPPAAKTITVVAEPVVVPIRHRAIMPSPRAVEPAASAEVADLRVTGDGAQQQVVIELPAGCDVGRPASLEGNGFELAVHGASIPDRLRRTLDASAFGGPVATVSSFNVGRGEARIVIAAAPGTRQELTRDGNSLTWKFTGKLPRPGAVPSSEGAQVDAHVDQAAPQVAGFTTAAADNGADLPKRTRYTGRRISLEFKDIDIQNLLRLFADISHKNVVVSDDVKGKVTIALRNVPWDQAFDLILKTHGLGKEESGNILRVAPVSELEKERKEALDAQKARAQLEPLRVRLIPVNYALAGDVSDKIKDVLSERGVVTVDGRTNVLIVKDIAENLAKAEGMVRNLDTQTPQVLIESRIVEASTQYNREIGIQWGGNAGFAPNTNNSTGLVFPSTATVTGAAGGSPNAGTAANPNFAINLPAAIGQGAGGGLGFIFGSAGGAFNLNLRLSALEANGVVKTVSAPKVATIDNAEASISQGVSIPFAQVSAAGVQTAFIEARLELKVTPHVTSDGSVLLKISATNNQPNAGITGANGQPSISRKEAKTQMLVKDGDTTVIGGIYTRATGVSTNQVPLFGQIPILGWLFKHRADSDQRTELLVFITPRILNRQQVVTAGN